jgi:hypothetical protein
MGIRFTRVKNWLFSMELKLGLVSNSISTRTLIDSLGRQVSQPLNVDGGRNLGLIFSLNKKIWSLDMGMDGNLVYTRNVNFVNADLSQNETYTSGGGFTLAKNVAEKYSFQLGTHASYFTSQSSINTAAPIHYWTENQTASLNVFLLQGFELNTIANYSWQQKNNAFGKDISVFMWSASAGKNFLANRLALKFQLNNILNQNSGISRSNSGNTNTETSTNILGRYWQVSLAWRFEKKFRLSKDKL